MGRHRTGTREQARGCQRTGGLHTGRRAHPHSPRRRRRSSRAACARPPCSGTKRIGTDHLLLALLDDPASTGARILTDLASLPIGEMREHLRRELAHRPTPGPAHRIPIRLSNDEYTHAHTAGQNLETK